MVRPSNLSMRKCSVSFCGKTRHQASGKDTRFLLLDVVHRGNSSLGVIFIGVADESKSTASASVAIFDHNLVATNGGS